MKTQPTRTFSHLTAEERVLLERHAKVFTSTARWEIRSHERTVIDAVPSLLATIGALRGELAAARQDSAKEAFAALKEGDSNSG